MLWFGWCLTPGIIWLGIDFWLFKKVDHISAVVLSLWILLMLLWWMLWC